MHRKCIVLDCGAAMERDANINKRICCTRCATDQCSTRMISKRFRYIVYKLYMDEDCFAVSKKHVRNKIRKQFFFLSSPCCILWTLFVLWFSLHFFFLLSNAVYSCTAFTFARFCFDLIFFCHCGA